MGQAKLRHLFPDKSNRPKFAKKHEVRGLLVDQEVWDRATGLYDERTKVEAHKPRFPDTFRGLCEVLLESALRNFLAIEGKPIKPQGVMEVCGEAMVQYTAETCPGKPCSSECDHVGSERCQRPKGHEGNHDDQFNPTEFGVEPKVTSEPLIALPNAAGVAKFGQAMRGTLGAGPNR